MEIEHKLGEVPMIDRTDVFIFTRDSYHTVDKYILNVLTSNKETPLKQVLSY